MKKHLMIAAITGAIATGCGSLSISGGEEGYVASCDIVSSVRYLRDDTTSVVTDTHTCLQWEDENLTQKPWVTVENTQSGNYNDTSGDTATTYCNTLGLDGGGWRLPSKAELLSATDTTPGNPWMELGYGDNSFWSSTVVPGHDDVFAWWATMGADDVRGDYVNSWNRDAIYPVRCVRTTNANIFKINE